MKAIILARVSSKEQEDNNSIPSQTRRLLEYAEKYGLEVIDTYQLVESSTKTNRKKFSELIARIKESPEKIALVTDTIDRLQRGFRESVMLDELRSQNKIELHFVRENLIICEASNSSELLRWDMGVMFAKSYVTQLSDNVKRSTEQKRKNGEWSGLAPFGYKNIDLENGKKWIVTDTSNSQIVISMYQWYATSSYSMKEIRQKLINEYELKLAISQIDRILKNKFYFGVMHIKCNDYPHVYDPIISKTLFDEVQNVKAGRNKKVFKYAGLPFHYRGLIRCGECGCSITPEHQKGHDYYHCTQYKGKHGAKWMREEELTKQLKKAFEAIQIAPEDYDAVKAILKTSHDDKIKYKSQNIAHIQAELSKIQNRLDRLHEVYLDGDIDKESYKTKAEEYKSIRDSLKDKLNAVDGADDKFYKMIEYFIEIGQNAPLLLESSEMEERRLLINLVLQNLTLNGDQLRWEYKKPFDILYQTAQSQNWLGMRDSNPRCWDQNPVPYRLANPQYVPYFITP